MLVGTGARIHRAVASRFRDRRAQPSCAVLSVGALTMGGAGKTPVAARLALALSQRGHRVALASRGYKGQARTAVTIVSDGTKMHAPLAEAGDEPLLLAAHAPGVPVLVGRDRRHVGLAAVARFGCEMLVLDDGFQHHRLRRDVDFVCIDGVSGLGNGRVFPAGPLRETPRALRQADWICFVRGESSGAETSATADEPELNAEEEALLGSLSTVLGDAMPSVAVAERRLLSLRGLGRDGSRSPGVLAGLDVGLVAGVGRPENVRRSIEGLGANVVATRLFPDHHAYRPEDFDGLASEAEIWVTTEKDALKILPEWTRSIQLEVLEMRVQFASESRLLEALETALKRPDASTSNRAKVSRA